MPRRPPEIQVDVVFRLGQCDKEKHGWRGGLPLVLTARIAPATGLHPHGELMVERKKNTAICWQPARFAVPLSICAILALCLAVGLPTVFLRQWFLGTILAWSNTFTACRSKDSSPISGPTGRKVSMECDWMNYVPCSRFPTFWMPMVWGRRILRTTT